MIESVRQVSIAHHAGALLARCLIVFGLIPNGAGKLAEFDKFAAAIGGMPQMINGQRFPGVEPWFNFPLPEVFLASSVTFDILGAVLVMIGLRTRAVAAALFVYCVFVVAMYHNDLALPENVRAVIRTGPLFGGLLLIALVGAGGWSVDEWLNRRRVARRVTAS